MKFKTLIRNHIKGTIQKIALTYLQKHKLGNTDVSTDITRFIDRFSQNSLITTEEFERFSSSINHLGKHGQAVIVDILFRQAEKIYYKYKSAIDKDIAVIESCVRGSKPLPENTCHDKQYHALINVWRFLNNKEITDKLIPEIPYPGIDKNKCKLLNENIPFALNTLRLVGKLSRNTIDGLDLAKPFYPIRLNPVTKNKAAFQTGIKDSDSYFPFKPIRKLYEGETGNNTFVASNGHKILFIRGVEDYSPNGIFASKIATLISKKHFSSERLLDNSLVAAREIESYAISVLDQRIRLQRKQYIETEKRIFPGTGIIDEVTNFVNERDGNCENFGFSTANLKNKSCHLSKIDFDQCNVSRPLPKEKYEQDILSRPARSIYHGPAHIPQNDAYINEKLYTRLKLSMIPDMLLSEMADKSYLPQDKNYKIKAVAEMINRKKLALELFFEHPKSIEWLQKNPDVINQCFNEIGKYINKHGSNKELVILQKKALMETALAIHDQCQAVVLDTQLTELRLEEHSGAELQCAARSVNDEIQRLAPFSHGSNNFFVTIGIMETSDHKITAFKKLENILKKNHVDYDQSDEFYNELQEWKQQNWVSVSRQRNYIHRFFAPDHRSEAIKKIEEVFANLEAGKKIKVLA